MKWLSSFRRPPPIASAAALIDFLDAEIAFVAQKCATGYCWAKAGLNAQKLFSEPDFQAALNACRWESFAAVAGDAALLVEGRLRPLASRPEEFAGGCMRLHAAVLHRHSAPPALARGWAEEIERFEARLARARLSPPLPVGELARTGAKRLYESLPLHPELRRHDEDVVANAVRFEMIAFSAKLEGRLDAQATARALEALG